MNPMLIIAAVKAAAVVTACLASAYASVTMAHRLKDPAIPLFLTQARQPVAAE